MSGFITWNASGSDEHNLPGLWACTLCARRAKSRRLKIQRRGAGLCLRDCKLNLVAIRLKQERGSSQDAGAQHHHAIGQRERIHIVAGRTARLIDQTVGAEPRGHPRRDVQNQHVVARSIAPASQSATAR